MVTCGLYNLGKVESVQNFEIGWWEGHPTLKVRFLNNRVVSRRNMWRQIAAESKTIKYGP